MNYCRDRSSSPRDKRKERRRYFSLCTVNCFLEFSLKVIANFDYIFAAVASRLKRKGGGGAAAQAGERGGGRDHQHDVQHDRHPHVVTITIKTLLAASMMKCHILFRDERRRSRSDERRRRSISGDRRKRSVSGERRRR